MDEKAVKIFLTVAIIPFILFGCNQSTGTNDNETTEYELNVIANPADAGSVSPVYTTVEENEEIELNAGPANGYLFTHWSGDIDSTSDNPLSLIVDQDYSITANFEKKSYELTVNTEGEGAVSEEIAQQKSTDYEHGTVVELTAEPAEGWQLVEWTGDVTGTDNPIQITVNDPKEVTAIFEKKTLGLTVNTTGNGSLTKTPEQSEYEYGTEVTLEATPDEGWKFKEWTGDIDSTDNPITITITNNTELTANFNKVNYELTATANPSEGGSVSPTSGTFELGTEVRVEATPNEGWAFTNWTGDIESSENPLAFTIDKKMDVIANFEDQRSVYTVKMKVIDSRDTLELRFGQQQGATQGFDNGIDKEAPPPPPGDALHTYFETKDLNLFEDFRSNLKKQVDWNMIYDLGSGNELILEWNLAMSDKLPGNLILTDESKGFEVNMHNKSSYKVTSSSGSLLIQYQVE